MLKTSIRKFRYASQNPLAIIQELLLKDKKDEMQTE